MKRLLSVCLLIFSAAFIHAGEYGLKQALVLLNDGKIDEAVQMLRKELDKNPQDADVHFALGVSYLEKGNYNEAANRLENVLRISPESLPAYYSLAMLYEKEKNFSKAAEQWKSVLKLAKDKDVKELARKHLRHLEK